MTEATAPALEPGPGEFLKIWSGSFSQAMGQITSAAVPCAVLREAPADFPPAAEGDLWAAVTSTGGLRGEMSLRISAAALLRLAQTFMSEPPAPEAPPTADHREAVIELLRQVAGIVTSAAKARWGETQLLVEAAPAAPSWPAAATLWLQVGAQRAGGTAVEFVLSAALVAELRAEKAEAAKAATRTVPPIPAGAAAHLPGTLDLLMDVQLAVTMRFGSRRLLLREVLDLSPGSVIELDRKIQEPVDLLLDGRLVAHGEVVVIDGNYGLRVTDVSPLGPG
jgi:flagellar motor switch protein FliN